MADWSVQPPGRQLPRLAALALVISIILGACQPPASAPLVAGPPPAAGSAAQAQVPPTPDHPTPFPYPTRPLFQPGELVDYTAQPGDTLPALAARFNTSVQEILQANTFIPATATTMPPGMPMKIPIYYLPLWGSPYQIIPDSLFVDGPAQDGFDTAEFVRSHPGWLNSYSTYAADATRSGAEVVDLVAGNYSVSPRLLLALLEYMSSALSQPALSAERLDYPLGYRSWDHKGLYMQLGWAANLLNNGYYAWRDASLTKIETSDGRLERFDPWQNAATVSLHNFFNQLLPADEYAFAISAGGFAATYTSLFGDPWQGAEPHIPGSLAQPEFRLPFKKGEIWAYTGGPHTGWGLGEPLAAIDFAPPSIGGGCLDSSLWVTAVTAGVVVRSETGLVVLDLDGDGDERTGWTVFYLHLATDGRAPLGAKLNTGDPLGHPSCEGGSATGTHVHIARKYNGEWIPADGILPFTMEGWQVRSDGIAYQGRLVRFARTVTACVCSNAASFIQSER